MIPTDADPANCGGCGVVCPAKPGFHATCSASKCGAECNTGLTLCNGTCVDLTTDLHNCWCAGLRTESACPALRPCTTTTLIRRAGVQGVWLYLPATPARHRKVRQLWRAHLVRIRLQSPLPDLRVRRDLSPRDHRVLRAVLGPSL